MRVRHPLDRLFPTVMEGQGKSDCYCLRANSDLSGSIIYAHESDKLQKRNII